MKILSRYVLKEHAGPLVFALAALTSLLLLNYVAKQFGQLVGKGLPWTAIAEFFALSIPFTVATTLPMAVLISTLYAFSRLAAENEITALKASGVGMYTVMRPVIAAATIVSLLMIAFNDQVLSRANHQLAVLQTDIARTKPTFALREQVINPVSPGRLYVRTGHIDRATNRMREVTIYDLSDPSRARTIVAERGTLGFSTNGQDLVMTLFDGYMSEVSNTDPSQLQRLFFQRNRMRVRGIGGKFTESEDVSYKGPREKTICEMQDDYEVAAQAVDRSRAELEAVLVGITHVAATGQYPAGERERRVALDSVKPKRRPFTIGGAYCAFLGLFGVKQAHAAEPAPQLSGSRARRARERELVERQQRERDSLAALHPDQQRPAAPAPSLGISAAAGAGGDFLLPPYAQVGQGGLEVVRARVVEAERTRDLYGVEIHKKFALAIACIVFVLIGAPVALRFPRGGVGLVISVSLVVFALYYVGLIAGQSLAEHGTLSPFLSMWLANIVFGLLGLILFIRMGREQSTSRGGDMRELRETIRVWLATQGRKIGLKTDRRRRVVT